MIVFFKKRHKRDYFFFQSNIFAIKKQGFTQSRNKLKNITL